MEPILQCNNIRKTYDTTVALHGFNLTLESGKIVGLLGPNGSGKTTLIKLIAGLLTPNCGEIKVCGNSIGPASKALVSYLPDRICFKENQKVSQIIETFSDFFKDFDKARAEAMLQGLQIDPQDKFKKLSKGTQEKVQLVLAMSRRAKLYLLDEPIAGVDPAARDYILRTVLNNYDRDATILISTHLIADVEQVLDEYLFLHFGRIVESGTVDELRERTGGSLDAHFREVFKCFARF